jgi:hypothetical protein
MVSVNWLSGIVQSTVAKLDTAALCLSCYLLCPEKQPLDEYFMHKTHCCFHTCERLLCKRWEFFLLLQLLLNMAKVTTNVQEAGEGKNLTF